ncbi:MAG: S41 family peptidase [Bacteroidales bacterium]
MPPIWEATVLTGLHDGHLHLYTPWGILGNENYFSSFSSSSVDDNTAYFDTYHVLNSSVQWGKILNSSLAYLYIRTFEGNSDNFDMLDSLVKLWSNTFTGLIIDIRGNRGGLVENSLRVSSLFLSSTRCIGKLRRCVDGRKGLYTSWASIIVQPAHLHTFQKPVVVLTDRFTYSAAEWFVIALANQSHITIVGDTTGGGISLPVVRELPNGWLLSIPNTQFLSSGGQDFQFTGYPPHISVVLSSDDRQHNRDMLLKHAIDWLLSAK